MKLIAYPFTVWGRKLMGKDGGGYGSADHENLIHSSRTKTKLDEAIQKIGDQGVELHQLKQSIISFIETWQRTNNNEETIELPELVAKVEILKQLVKSEMVDIHEVLFTAVEHTDAEWMALKQKVILNGVTAKPRD